MSAPVTDKPSKPQARANRRVREKILEAAGELFYRHGIRGVGVDAITTAAGTNKMSFYRNFPSKDHLVADYLRAREREYWDVWDAAIRPHQGDPRRQIEALFATFTRAECLDGAECKTGRGCALGNAAVEIGEDDQVLGVIVHAYKAEMRRRLRKLARELGARDPNALGDALMLLMEGGYYTRLTFAKNGGPVTAIVKAARALMAAHTPRR